MILSILIAAYNVEKYICECLDSICSQLGEPDVEIVVVDDGSTDGTGKLLASYRSDSVRVFHQKNRGIGETRNRLLEEARGKYIWFVDADDRIESSALPTILSVLKKGEVDILELSYSVLQEDLRIVPGKTVLGSYTCGTAFVKAGNYDNTVWTKVIRTGLIDRLGLRFEPLPTGEDFVFSFKLLALSGPVECISAACYLYRKRSESICSGRTPSHLFRLSDATMATIRSVNHFMAELSENRREGMQIWFRHYLTGYLFSLLRFPQYSFSYIEEKLQRLRSMNLYPVPADGLSTKMFLFLFFANTSGGIRCLKKLMINR